MPELNEVWIERVVEAFANGIVIVDRGHFGTMYCVNPDVMLIVKDTDDCLEWHMRARSSFVP